VTPVEHAAMKVSVVITTFNRRSSLERCLKSLAEQTFPPGEFEVVVVSDGCTDGTDEFLRTYEASHGFRWLTQKNTGQPAAQNAGIAAASGEIVIMMDDDCICDPGLVAAHDEAHRDAGYVVVIGPLLLHPDTPRGTLQSVKGDVARGNFKRLTSGGICRADLMLCANSSISRQAALECPFDPSYKRMHDVEAGLRLWAKGYRPKVAANAVIYEYFTKPVAGVLSDARYQGRYEVLLAQKHPEFKPLAALVRLNEGNPLKRWLRKQLAIRAGVCEFGLRLVYVVSETLRGLPLFGSIAHRVLRARFGVQHIRGGIEQAGSWKVLEKQFGQRVPVIIYHKVGRPHAHEYPGLTTPPAEFETQIRLLQKMGYKAIVPEDWLRWREAGGELPEKPVMLVFDDAYEEAAEVAFPMLHRCGLKAACMVVTSCIGTTNRWDEEAGRPSFQMMNESQIQEWARKGIEFGGHTSSHPELPLVSDERVEEEVAQCKQSLAKLLGKAPVSFAYPFGSLSAAATAAVSRHFQLGFTSWRGRLHLAGDPFRVPRIAFLPGESKVGMWCRLRMGRNPFEEIRSRWSRSFGRSPRDFHAGISATPEQHQNGRELRSGSKEGSA
jgi:glycosyltransferase involved in cell wall biosynthesis/peptidoglycan/xylan/chitin deacetylase (PgdA/CDA1 family)